MKSTTGKARQVALFGGFDDAFFDGRDEVPGDGSAEDFVVELELSAARQRLHANPAIAELAVAAGLLLVAALHVGLAADGFAIRNLGRVQLDIHAVALLQAADDHFDVLLPAAGQQELLGLRVAIKAQRRVLFEDACAPRCPCGLRRCASWPRWRRRWKARAVHRRKAISEPLSASVSPVSVSFSLATPPMSPA